MGGRAHQQLRARHCARQALPEFDPLGIPLVTLALWIDSAIGPVQEKCFRLYQSEKSVRYSAACFPSLLAG